MKYTFAFVKENNFKTILDGLCSIIELSPSQFDIFFLTKAKNLPSDLENEFPSISFKILQFDELATEDEMIEFFLSNEQIGHLVLTRESAQNINFDDYNRLLKSHNKQNLLIVSKRNKEKQFISKFFEAFKKFFIKLITGFKIYDGEGDIMLLDNFLISIIKSTSGRSAMFLKLNTWTGVSPAYLSINNQPNIKSKFQAKKMAIPLYCLITAVTLMFAGHGIFAGFKISLPFIGLLAYIFIEVALVSLIFYYLGKILFYKQYGKINFIRPAILSKSIDNIF